MVDLQSGPVLYVSGCSTVEFAAFARKMYS
jgi:hypothetical protein